MYNTIRLLTTLTFALNAKACQLCLNSLTGLRNPRHNVNEHGKNCAMLAVEIFPLKNNSRECWNNIVQYRFNCCINPNPPSIPQIEKPRPTFQGKRGPYKTCDLCHNKNYPKNTAMVLNMLYLGVGSCAQYYLYGEGGLIPDHLCPALQYFSFEPCGC